MISDDLFISVVLGCGILGVLMVALGMLLGRWLRLSSQEYPLADLDNDEYRSEVIWRVMQENDFKPVTGTRGDDGVWHIYVHEPDGSQREVHVDNGS